VTNYFEGCREKVRKEQTRKGDADSIKGHKLEDAGDAQRFRGRRYSNQKQKKKY